jgi:hypothetical protein
VSRDVREIIAWQVLRRHRPPCEPGNPPVMFKL